MKKLFTLAAIATALPLIAVESANIVGYNTVTIDKQYQLIAVNFQGTTGSAMDIQTAFPVSAGMTSGNSLGNADQIQIMNADGDYDQYYLSNGYNGKAATPATANKWVKNTAKTAPTTDTFPVGKGAWFVRKSASTELKFINPAAPAQD